MAARALNFPEITDILNEVLSLGGRVLFGGAIIAAGFLVAKLLSNAIGSGTASTVIRYATLVPVAAMVLQYMGIADSIITLAFGSIVVAVLWLPPSRSGSAVATPQRGRWTNWARRQRRRTTPAA